MRQLRSCFPALVDRTFQVFGQLEYFNQRDELFFGELVIQEDLRVGAAGVVALEHRLVRKERFVVEILRARRAVPHAGMALDAHTRDLSGVLAADAAHRAERRAYAAAGAFAPVSLRLGLEEVFRLAVRSEGTVVGRVRVAVHGDGRGDPGHFSELCHDRRNTYLPVKSHGIRSTLLMHGFLL